MHDDVGILFIWAMIDDLFWLGCAFMNTYNICWYDRGWMQRVLICDPVEIFWHTVFSSFFFCFIHLKSNAHCRMVVLFFFSYTFFFHCCSCTNGKSFVYFSSVVIIYWAILLPFFHPTPANRTGRARTLRHTRKQSSNAQFSYYAIHLF